MGGRLVKEKKIKSLEEIYLYSLPIKEHEIIDEFIGPALKDEVLKIMPVQKQTRPVKEPGSRLLLPLETTMDTLVLVSSAPRRWPPPSEELSSWPSSPSFLSDVVSGEIRSVALTPFLARLLESADQSG